MEERVLDFHIILDDRVEYICTTKEKEDGTRELTIPDEPKEEQRKSG